MKGEDDVNERKEVKERRNDVEPTGADPEHENPFRCKMMIKTLSEVLREPSSAAI